MQDQTLLVHNSKEEGKKRHLPLCSNVELRYVPPPPPARLKVPLGKKREPELGGG